jgi:PPP family 3-phenylpropionic acid transporter
MTPQLAALLSPAGRATSAYYIALFAAIGAHMPFWPVWLADWGLSEGEIGLYLGCAIGARVFAGVFAPWLADVTGRRRTALVILALAAFTAFAAHPFAGTRPVLFLLTLAAAAAIAASIPIGDALAAAAGRLHGFDYAPVRAVGSAAFMLANLGCGVAVAWFGSTAALVWILVSLAALAVFSSRHPGGVRGTDPRPRLADMGVLLRSRVFVLAAVASASMQAAHAPLYAYGSLDWRMQGIPEATIGALWAWGVALEIVFMVLFGASLTRRIGPAGLFLLSGVANLIRWPAMMLTPSLEWLWAVQALHAVTSPAAHLAMIGFVMQATPRGLAASAQGLIGPGAGSIAMALGTLAAAGLHDLVGPGIHGVGVVLTLVGLVASWRLMRCWDGGLLHPVVETPGRPSP